VIGLLRRILHSLLGEVEAPERQPGPAERLDAARRRLKETIQSPAD
jgi:hypothetical protein